MSEDKSPVAVRSLEAAAWRMHIEAGSGDRQAFEEWLADPANASAWSGLDGALELISEHASDRGMMDLRRAALEHARCAAPSYARRWKTAMAAIAAAAILGVSGVYWLMAPHDYQTAFNERRVITLTDGSRISLDSDSEVTVRYSGTAREIRLLRGQARFDVAHDVMRPFWVLARTRKVVATGTAFNIDITQPGILVTLIEGHVVIFDEASRKSFPMSLAGKPAARPRDAIQIQAGQQLAALPDRTPVISRADMRTTLAWTSGQLVFDDRPLREIVARVNHYSVRPIVFADARAGRLRLSGSFNAGDVDGFVDIVSRYLPVEWSEDADGRIVLREK